MKTLRLRLPVLDADDVETLLELVTDVPGVAAAMIDDHEASLDVVVESRACGLLVQEQVIQAMLFGLRTVPA